MMSKSKSRTVSFIGDADDVPVSEIDAPPPLFTKESLENCAIKCVKNKKSKRQHSLSCSSASGLMLNNLDDSELRSKDDSHKHISTSRLPFGKNSRKSRMGLKEHKKGGGGKGMWNNNEVDLDELEIDKKDPCYDSDNDSVSFEVTTPILNEDEFDELFTNWIKEYFENAQASEVLENLSELNLVPELSLRIPYLCIIQALQRKPAQCELTSRLLCELIGTTINDVDMAKGFDLIIKEMSELTIDCPEAPEIVGKFFARAVADDLLAPKYVQSYKTSVENDYQLRALAKAENLLTLNQAYARLDTVWGAQGGKRPTKMLISKIRFLLAEYLDSDDEIEAERCLRELEAPHFHHELVFQAVLMVLEKSTEFVCNKMIKLLECLCKSVVITIDQFEQGVTRVYEQMPDIQLDVPAAYILLERFINLALKNGTFFPENLAKKMPRNMRSRFLSEGGVSVQKRLMNDDY